MLAVSIESAQGKRLIHEGRVLSRRLRRLVKAGGGKPGGFDGDAQKLNHELGADIVGLVAVRIRLRASTATLVSAPGAYFDPSAPERRMPLERVAAARRAMGRRVIVVSKHEIIGRTPFDLEAAFNSAPPIARRESDRALVSTGRRAREASAPGGPAAAQARATSVGLAAPDLQKAGGLE